MNESYDEAELLNRIQAGDKAACAECIEIHSPAVPTHYPVPVTAQ